MEKEKLTALENEQSALLKEFEDSKLGVDEFILKYFKEKGVADPEATLKRMDETFKKIDERYEFFRIAREKGKDSASALRKIFNRIFEKLNPENAGKILTGLIKALGGEPATEQPLKYEGLEAADLINSLDETLYGIELGTLVKNEEDLEK